MFEGKMHREMQSLNIKEKKDQETANFISKPFHQERLQNLGKWAAADMPDK